MYFYPILYSYSLETPPMANNFQMIQNYAPFLQNP